MADLICDRCGTAATPSARYCPRCGNACNGPLVRSLTRVSTLLQQWRGLSHSLTRRDVRKLLGEPARIEPADLRDAVRVETWRYDYARVAEDKEAETTAHNPKVAGSVQFAQDEGRVLTWTEPNWEAL